MTTLAAEPGPPEPGPDAPPLELLDYADRLLALHDEQERPEEAGLFWRRCRDCLLRARDLLEGRADAADPAVLARARYLLGLTLSVGYWQAVRGNDEAYGVGDPLGTRREATTLLALARATLPTDDPDYATACVRLGLLLHGRYEDVLEAAEAGRDADADVRDDDLDEALAAFDDGIPRLVEEPHPGLFSAYGCALADRYDHDPTPERLEHAAAVLDSVLEGLRPAGWEPAEDGAGSWADEADELETEARIRLIRLLEASPDPDDTALACEHLELLAATLPEGHESRIFTAGRLVDLYRERGDGPVSAGDRPAYLARLRDLHRLLDPANVHHPRATALLGTALAERATPVPPGGMPTSENEEAVGLLREALDGLADNDALRPSTHAVLGCLINSLRDFHPARYDNGEALRHLERAVGLFPADDPLRGDLLAQLAHATLVRNDEVHPDLAGVDRTIALLNESARLPSGVSDASVPVHGAYAAALSQRHALSNSADDLEAAIRHLTAAFRKTAADDANRLVCLHNLAVNLYQRYQAGGDHQDLEAAARYLQEVGAAAAGTTGVPMDVQIIQPDRLYIERSLVQMQFMLALMERSEPGMTAAVEAMRTLRDSVPEDAPERLPFDADFGVLLVVRSFYGGSGRDRFNGLVLTMEAAQALPEDHPDRPVLLLRAAGAMMTTAFAPYNKRAVAAAEKLLTDAADVVAPDSQLGLRVHASHAILCHLRFLNARAPADADRAVELARSVLRRVADRPPSPLSAEIAAVLAESLRSRAVPGDHAAARHAGLSGLRDAATVVLLQAAAEPALQMARSAADRALKIARWCLDDGDLAGAVEALELGRGLVLHASTTTADVPALLREAGRADLAEEWEGGARRAPLIPDPATLLDGPGSLLGGLGEGAEPPLPDDLRQRTLAALAKSRAGTALMSPLTPDAVAAALRAADAHALVYLLPPGGGRPGTAIVVTRGADVGTVAFGLLRREGLDILGAYRSAHRSRQAALDRAAFAAAGAAEAGGSAPPGPDGPAPQERTPDPEDAGTGADAGPLDPGALDAAHARWRGTLEELCDWAGPVVMSPLARSPLIRAAGPEPHLVLVPFGELGGIPWHAAQLSSGLRHGGRPVRAVERLTLSYAASARQLQEVLSRPRQALDAAPVIVGNPDGTLPGAGTEARHIYAALYRSGGRLLGSVRRAVGRGVPAEVLAALPGRGGPGASVLHLACHARPSGDSPLDACLLLAPPEGGTGRLLVRDILRQARGRPPGAPGGLVVLDACVSDHASGDLDEALTLSTAFLAAGATAVVGSRWEVPDGLTGLMMYVFHDRLRNGATPVRALREAQLWLLDPERELPAGMPPAIADILNDGDPAALELWAAFSCQGH
jgi:hypothetical protein